MLFFAAMPGMNETITGTYSSRYRTLELKNNGRYIERLEAGCTSGFIFFGSWSVNGDSLLLCRDYWFETHWHDTLQLYEERPDCFLIKGDRLMYMSEDIAGIFMIKDSLQKNPVKQKSKRRRK
jgi:hypothetical protein